jgi:sortase A
MRMKVRVRKSSIRLMLKWAQRTLSAGAILTLGYSGWIEADAWIFQHRATQTLDRMVAAPPVSPVSLVRASPSLIAPDGLIGRIEIDRLGVSVVVVEGAEMSMLRRAAGHIAGTALPGQIGNIGIAAHRDTFFRPLRNILRGDVITLTTLRGRYHYRVLSTKVVNPDDVAVLDSDGNEILTLVTCYPFYFVGAAPNRFIVRAERIL